MNMGLPGWSARRAHLTRAWSAVLKLPDFNTADELREAVKSSSFEGELSSSIVRLHSTIAKL